MKRSIFPLLIIIGIISVLSLGMWFLFGQDSPETRFLKKEGFLTKGNTALKPLSLVEQNIDNEKELFKVMATKLTDNTYQMAFKLENRTSQSRDFYLIPVSRKNQFQFQGIEGSIIQDKPLSDLYDIEQHKKELSPELAKAYNDINNNNYQANPVRVTVPAKSVFLSISKWNVQENSPLSPVYLLVQGSAGGVKDDLVILTVHSYPQQGDYWQVEFAVRGAGDLKIIPNDQATIDDDEFTALYCDDQELTPQILPGDVIYYPNWNCQGIGKVIHYTKKKGNHTLRFEFNKQTAYAYNSGESWLSGWTHRKKVTIQQTNIDASLDNFPLMVKVSSDSDMGSYVQLDGDDIRFTASDGQTKLNFEKESFFLDGGNMSGIYWVDVPSILAVASGSATDIYVYYGNGSALDGSSATSVWSSASAVGVWHLDEGSGNAIDSTSNGNNGVVTGAAQGASGKIGNAYSFDGNTDYVDFGDVNAVDGLSAMTISVWLKSNEAQNVLGNDWVIKKEGSGEDTFSLLWSQSDYMSFEISTTASGDITNSTVITDFNNWHHIIALYNGTNMHIYKDGVNIDSATVGSWTPPLPSTAHSLMLGYNNTTSWNGLMDDVRIYSKALSAAEIKFSYYNQNATASGGDYELTWGVEESSYKKASIKGSTLEVKSGDVIVK